MSYFKIGNKDFSSIVNELKINEKSNYSAQSNAAGNTVVDYINSKREIEVGIIPLEAAEMVELLEAVKAFGVSISFLNPITNALEENVSCIIPSTDIEFYTIQSKRTLYKACKLKFTEL